MVNANLTLPTKVPSDSLGRIGSLKRTSDKSLFPMALGSCGHRITHQLRPINMNGRSILSVTSNLGFVLLLVLSAFSPPRIRADAPPRPQRKLALLVGCTHYELPKLPELWGPANDIPLWSKQLVDGFGFARADVQVLVGWPDDSRARPTYANIIRAFENLINAASEGNQIVVILSGHGSQVPVPEGNDFRLNPEPDGMDEVFLPADVRSWGPGGVVNAIKDDQIGGWLDRLRGKGAHVFIVFDSCNSGTMTRGSGGSGERPRGVRPAELGVPDEAIRTAADRARAAGVEPPARPRRGVRSPGERQPGGVLRRAVLRGSA